MPLAQRFRRALLLWLLCSAAGFVLAAASANAQTPRLQGQSAAAAAMGNAFVAQADDPSALHYNPAGMTQLHGFQTLFGTTLIGGTTQFSSPTGAQTTGDRNGSVAWPPPGHVYLVANLKDLGLSALGNFTAGIGMNNPFGSLTRYPNDGPFRTAITFTTLPLLDIKPTIAYKLNDQLSFGVGADIYTFSGLFGEGHLEQKSIWPGGLGIPAGSLMEINGSDTTAGFNVSLLYTPFRNSDGKPLVNIGMVYRSQATFHLTGNFLANGASVAGATATFVLPQVFSGGIGIWPVRTSEREWKLEFDVDYTGWKSNRNLDVHLTNGALLPFPQNWQSTYTVMIGTEYRWLRLASMPDWDIALRAGYMNQQAQIPDRTFNPGVPSANTHIPSVGIGLACHENGSFLGLVRCGKLGIGPLKPKLFAIDLAYQAGLYEVRTIAGNQNPTVNGRYDSMVHVGSLSLRFNY
ncbi:MAG: outer membrane protein transport protein [Nitrospira sp.]|jgi:long-chain fatty acid transport protein|nr:outer membrane protein transport protein [Nitrospira sp.]